MKKAVMFGAGNIGRGFIGQVFSMSGMEVVFLDVVESMINEFNKRHEYIVRVVSNSGNTDMPVRNVRAVLSTTPEAVGEIASADIMATAVGVNILKRIAPVIAEGIRARKASGKGTLNIILAENQLDADKIMRGYIYEHLSADEQRWADENIGLVEASIGRMVPRMTDEQKKEDPLLICVESYSLLPVDADAFKGEIPELEGLVPFSPFGFYIKRKLFLHNMGHALLAYLGNLKGYEYIWQAAEDDELYNLTERAMLDIAGALHDEYGVPINEITDNVYDLLDRFKNRALGDTVERVGADPIRKLRRDDRLVGAALYIYEHGGNPSAMVKGILAALKFVKPTDVSSVTLNEELKINGIDRIITDRLGLSPDEPLYKIIKDEYEKR